MGFQQEQLENGLTIITDHLPEAEGLSVYWSLRAGSRHEIVPGVAHFLEHMICESRVSSGKKLMERWKEISPPGGQNFLTGPEYIYGYINTLPSFAPEIFEDLGSGLIKLTPKPD